MANKSADAFRTISEVAERLNVPAHVLRFWESRFTQIKPVKRGGGRRYYRPQDVHLLLGIQQLLHGEHMTIKGAQKIIRENGVRHVITLGEALDAAPASPAETRAPVAPPAVTPKDVDLFEAATPPPPRAPAHRPFPPDPARINPRTEQLRRALRQMISLRDRMKAASA